MIAEQCIKGQALHLIDQLVNPLYLFKGEQLLFVNQILVSIFNEITEKSYSAEEIICKVSTSNLRKIFGHGVKEQKELEKIIKIIYSRVHGTWE